MFFIEFFINENSKNNTIHKIFYLLMKLNKVLKFSIVALVSFPLSFFVGDELLAKHLTERFEYALNKDNLLACGGGGGGGGGASPAAKAEKKVKQAKAKLSFKKRQLSKLAAAGESTTELEAEIAELEALLVK